MRYKIYDYERNDFRRLIDKNGKYIYYIKVNSEYVEVSKEVYLICKRSYEKIKYDRKREVTRSVHYYGDIDQVASLVFLSSSSQLNMKIYLKDLIRDVVAEIYKLPIKYKNIAICIFLEEKTITETSKELGIPMSTVGKRKIKIQNLLKEFIKKRGEDF